MNVASRATSLIAVSHRELFPGAHVAAWGQLHKSDMGFPRGACRKGLALFLPPMSPQA